MISKESRVCYLTDIFESNYLRDRPMLTHLLAKRGYNVLAVSSTYLNGKIMKKPFFQKWDKKVFPARVARVKTIMIERNYSPPIILFFPFMVFFKKFDIIHVHGVGAFASYLGMLRRIISRDVKLVMTADMNESTFFRIKKSILYKHIMSLPLKVADAVVVYTDRERDFLIEIGINYKKINQIPMSIRFNELSQINNRLDPNKIVLGFLGKIQPIKGVHRLVDPLLRIMKEYSQNVKVIFAGPSQDQNYTSRIIPLLRRSPNFEYWGPLPLEKVDNFYRACNIIFVPSLSEACPAVPLEAMAAGKCVIASKISPIDKFIIHGKSGFLIDNDQQFYEYTTMLLNNPTLIMNVGNYARKNVGYHSQENVICMFVDLYEHLLAPFRK